MIIVVYPGIEKASLAKIIQNYIDFESFSFHNENIFNWESLYVDVVVNLSKQSNIVFVNSHYSVLLELQHRIEVDKELDINDVLLIYPKLDDAMEKDWVEHLTERCIDTRKDLTVPFSTVEKNYKALDHVKKNYRTDISNMMISSFNRYELQSMDYDLYDIIQNFKGSN